MMPLAPRVASLFLSDSANCSGDAPDVAVDLPPVDAPVYGLPNRTLENSW